MSDVDDEELAALRAAALASLKLPVEKPSFSSSNESNHITAINTVVASTSNYTPYPEISGYSNQYSWRNSGQASRRSRGNRPFPKVSQRSSNLIVITPVNTEDKDSTSHLVLPQHKWCQSANEDSSSPKTYRRTGPMRFNRLESGSESSDSDYDNSDNDSYSNETILQDEPSDHFAGRSGDSIGNESSPEKPVPERRFSFQNIDSDLNLESFQGNESTSVYKCLKTTYPGKSEGRPSLVRSPSVENDSEHSWKHESHRNYAYGQYDANVENKHSEQTEYSAKLPTVNGGSPKKLKISSVLSMETDSSRLARRHGETPLDNGSRSDLNSKRKLSNSDQSKLSDNDLRLELKKRMHEFQNRSESSRKQSQSPGRSHSRSRSRDRSHLRSSQSRDHSESKNHVRGSSSSQKHARSRSRSINGHRSRSPRRNRSPSPRRNRSSSPHRSQSPHRNRSQSPRRNHSRSPRRNRSRRRSPSPEKHRSERHRRRGDRSQSPVHDRKRDRSPHRNHRRERNSSQDRKRDEGQKSSHRSRYHRGHSNSSSASSSSSSSTSKSTSSLPLRSVSSVIKPVLPKDSGVKHEKTKEKRPASSSESDSRYSPKKNKKLDDNNLIASNVKSSVYGGENKSSASDGNKRVPVHMRLGSLPGKRVIQMTKDVEAAFVNTSSDDADEEVNGRRRKDNFHVMYDFNDNKSDESSKKHFQRNSVRSTDAPKDRRLKHRR